MNQSGMRLGFRAWLRAGFVASALVLLAVALSTCGGGRKAPVAPLAQVTGVREQVTGEIPEGFFQGVGGADQPREITVAQAIAQLEEMEAPTSVDEAVFAQLKKALRETLRHQWGASTLLGGGQASRSGIASESGGAPGLETDSPREGEKLASSPPTGEANRVDDLALIDNGDGTYTLTWTYRNLGDYNQDGIVNIMDLTPLAVHFNEEADETNEWIDGSGDGIINIADITPLAANFFCGVAGYEIQGAPLEGEFAPLTTIPFSKITGTGEGRGSFAPTLTAGTIGASARLRVVPVDHSGEPGIPSNEVELPVSAPGIHSVTPTEWYTGEECTFTAAVSGTRPLNFSWDFDGGATPNEVTGDGDEVIAEVTLGEPGEYEASLTVSNLYGEDTHPFTLTVSERDAWVHTWGGPMSESAEDIAIDEDGNAYVLACTGSFGAGYEDVLVLKYAPDGGVLWARTWGTDVTESPRHITAVADGVLVVGHTYLGDARRSDVFFLKYDREGNLLWQKTWGTGDYEQVNGMATDTSGSIYVAGEWATFGGEPDLLVAKFGADGTCAWARKWHSGAEFAKAVVVDAEENVYVGGMLGGTPSEYTIVVFKYDSTGEVIWARSWGGDGPEWLNALALDASENLWVAASTRSFGEGDSDVLLLEYSSHGELMLSQTWGAVELDGCSSLVCDDEGLVYLAGATKSFGASRALLLKCDSGGDLVRSSIWSGDWSEIDSLDWNGGQNMYLAGSAVDATGSWQDAQGTINLVDGIVGIPEGTETELEGVEGTPEGIVCSPMGEEDIGAGGADVLLMKNFPD